MKAINKQKLRTCKFTAGITASIEELRISRTPEITIINSSTDLDLNNQ